MTVVGAVFALLLAYEAKHFLCDFPLQGRYMLGKFRAVGWFWPLAAHAAVHALGTALIVSWALYFTARQPSNAGAGAFIVWAAGFDFWAHFIMDRVKASPHMLGRFKPLTPGDYQAFSILAESGHPDDRPRARARLRGNAYFWWSLGLDQAVHHLTHIYIIYRLVTR